MSHVILITCRHFNNSLEICPLGLENYFLYCLHRFLVHFVTSTWNQLLISFRIHFGSRDILFLPLLSPPISSSHDCYKQLLSGDASIISVERNEHANHQQTARCVLKHPKRERKKKKTTLGHVTMRGRTNKYQKYMCAARERENCFISLLSAVKIL